MPASCACASFFGTPMRVTLVRETEADRHLENGHAPRGKRLPSSQVLHPLCTELPMALMWRCALFSCEYSSRKPDDWKRALPHLCVEVLVLGERRTRCAAAHSRGLLHVGREEMRGNSALARI